MELWQPLCVWRQHTQCHGLRHCKMGYLHLQGMPSQGIGNVLWLEPSNEQILLVFEIPFGSSLNKVSSHAWGHAHLERQALETMMRLEVIPHAMPPLAAPIRRCQAMRAWHAHRERQARETMMRLEGIPHAMPQLAASMRRCQATRASSIHLF